MSANEVFVSLDFTEADEGWGVTKFNSVEKAVLNVADGGTVRVAAGIYDEKIAIDGSTLSADKAFSLVGEKDAAGNLLTTFTGELVLGSYHRSPVPELNLQKGIDITDIAFAPAGDTAIDLSSIYSLNISGCEFTGDATGKDQLITARAGSNVGGIAVDGCTFENGYITLNGTSARSKGGFGFKLLNSKLAEAQINAPGVQQFIMQGNEISRTVPDGVEADNIYMVRIGTGASAIEDFQISGNTFTLANPSGSVLPVDEYWAAIVLRSSQASGIILTDNVFSSDLAEFSALYTNTSGLAEVSGNTIAVAGDKAIVNTTGECLDFSNNAWTDGAGNLLTDSSAIAGGIDGTVMASCYATSGTAGNYVYGVDEFIAKNGSAVGYSTETLKVDSAWSSYSFGDAIDGETGYYYGINAFSSLNDALAQKTAGTQTITTLSAIEETSDGGYALLGDLTLGGEKITYSGASLTFLGGGVNATLTVNADMALTTNSSGLLGVSYDGRPMTVKINSDVRAYIYYAYTGSTTIVNESGKLFATGEQLLARGTGTTITYNGNAAVGAAFEERTLQGGAGFLQLRDSGNIALNNTLFEVTAGAVSVNHISGTGSRLLLNNTYINDKGHPDSRNSQFIINAGDGLVQVDNHSSLVFSGSGVGTMTVNGNGSKLEITGNSLVSGYAVTNSGTIDVTGSALSAVSLANTGTVNVSGDSKISAAFTGELSIKDGAVLTTDGLTGTGHLVIDEGATATLSGSGFDFNGYIYGATNKYNQEGVAGFTLNIENAEDFSNSALYASNASRYNLMNSKVETTTLNVNATGKVAADKDSSVTVESAHILGALETSGELVADIFNIYAGFGADDAAGQVSLKSGSSTTVYRLLNIGTANRPDAKYNATATGDDEKIAKLDLDNATLKFVAIHGEVPHFYVGSDSSAGLLTATASSIELGENQSVDFRVGTLGTVVLSDTSFTLLRNSAFSNFGAVMTDYASTITVGGTFTNSGTITVDMTGAAANGLYKLIDNTGATAMTLADYGNVILNNAAGYTLSVIDNDLYALNADMSTIQVNAAWGGTAPGTEIVIDGKSYYYGINAFSGLNQALGEAAAGSDKIVIAAGTYDESAAQFVKGVEVVSESAVFSNVWSFGVNSDTGRDFDMATAEKFTVTGDLTVGQFYAEKNANVYVKIDGNLTTVGSFGAKLATQVDVNGTVTVTPEPSSQVMVYGTMNVTGTLDVTTGAMGAVLVVGRESYETEYGKGGVLNVSGADASVVLRNNTGSAIPVTVSAMSSLNISGGATFANETGGMQNLGTVNVDNATLTLGGTLENSGTVTVSGTSVLNISALTGEIVLADGATLTDSSVGGTVSAEGNVSVAGTTSVDRLVLKGVRGENSELSIGADAVVAVKQLEVGTGLQKPDLVPGDTAAREYFSKAQIDGTLTVDRANQSGAIYIRPYAELVVTGTLNVKGEVHNRGSLVVDGGTMNISDWETPKLLGYTTGDSLTVTNQGSMILTGVSAVTFGEAHASLAEMGVEAQYADGMFATISAGGKFEADTLAFRNDDDVTLTVTGEGSSFKLYSASGRTVTGTYNYAVNEGAIIVADKASFDVSGLANAEFVNSGSITLSSASAKFATLTNNGTVTVSGASTLNIGTLTGNMLQVVADTTLTDSVIGGNVSVGFNAENAADTTLTLAGDTSIGTLYVGKENRANDYKLVIAGEETTVTLGSLYSRTGSTTTISNGATLDISNYWQSKGTVTVDASTINHSGVNFYVYDNDSADTAAIALMNGAVLNHINANSLTLGSTTETVSGVAKGNASVTLEGGSTLNVNRLYLNATGTVEEVAGAEAKTSLTAVDSTVTARGEVGIGAGATVSLGNSAFTANTLISSGAIVMDSLSTITCAGAFTSTGTITARVDAAQSGVSFVQKLINASTLTVNDSLTVEGGREGAQLVATGNALWLDNSDKSTILINSEYAGEVGSAIAGRDGYFFGFNALTEYSTSIGADSAVEFTGGSYSFADGFSFTGREFTVSGDTSFDKVTGGAVAVTGGTLSIGTVDLTADIATLSGALLAFSGSGMADLANLVLTVSGTMANRTKYVLATGVKDDSFAITLNGETYELNVRKDGLLVGVENGELYVQKSDDWFMLSRDLVQTVLPEDGYAFGGSDMYESAVMSTERKLNVVTNSQNTGARVYGGGLLRNDALFSGTQKCEVTVTAGGVGKGVIGGNRVESGSIGGTLTSSVTIDSADGTFGFIVGGNQLTGGELNGFGGTSVTIQNGTFSMWISGGSVAGGDATAQVMGNTNVTITGGTFNGTGVFGGGFVQENGTLNQVGNTNVTISGGTFAGNIYGGHGATNKEASPNGVLFGNTNITISGGIFNGNIYGGGFDQSKVLGDTHITFTGTAGADFSVNGIIDGDASNARYWSKGSFVTGDRYLTFDAFSGEFGATLITNIDQMEVTGGSDVNLKNQLDLSEVSQWEFDFGSSLEGFAQNDLAGDSLVLSGWEDQLGDEGWTVMSGSSITGFGEMEVTNGSNLIFAWNADEQYYLGSIGDEQFKLSMEDGAMKLAKLA